MALTAMDVHPNLCTFTYIYVYNNIKTNNILDLVLNVYKGQCFQPSTHLHCTLDVQGHYRDTCIWVLVHVYRTNKHQAHKHTYTHRPKPTCLATWARQTTMPGFSVAPTQKHPKCPCCTLFFRFGMGSARYHDLDRFLFQIQDSSNILVFYVACAMNFVHENDIREPTTLEPNPQNRQDMEPKQIRTTRSKPANRYEPAVFA